MLKRMLHSAQTVLTKPVTLTGTEIIETETVNAKFDDFKMYGKTTQDGEPSPDNPVEIVNAGKYNEETGRYEIGCVVGNKNLWDKEYARDVNNWIPSIKQSGYSEIPVYVGTNNKVSISYKDTLSAGLGIFAGVVIYENGGIYSWLYHSTETNLNAKEKTITPVGDYIWIRCLANNINNGSFMQYIGNDLQIEIADAPTDFVSHQSQPLTLTSPVPLTKWDKLVKRDGVWGWSIWSKKRHVIADNLMSGSWNSCVGSSTAMRLIIDDCVIITNVYKQYTYCNILSFVGNIHNITDGTIGTCCYYQSLYMRIPNDILGVSDDATQSEKETAYRAYVQGKYDNGKPIIVQYPTSTEVAFLPLPDEEQVLMNSLQSYYPTTIIRNTDDLEMEVTMKSLNILGGGGISS